MRHSDFRSDTVTRPSEAMRQAMLAAEVGDDVLDGDPTVRRLEARAAEWLGKEGALFVPSGTMANQVAVGAWTQRGDQIILGHQAHIICWETGAAAALHGVQTVPVPAPRGVLEVPRVAAALRPDCDHCPPTALICVEQTQGDAGGAVVPLAALRELHGYAREQGIPVHMDGARLANAAVAAKLPAREIAACAETVSLCFSKGLGAPVGSVVAGDGAFLERARPVRKRLGGWMRQSGLIAAAALVGLEENVERLAEDHRLARALAEALHGEDGLSSPPQAVETNIVMVDVDPALGSAAQLAERFGEQGILVLAMGPARLRFVTHLDVGPADLERLREALRAVLEG